MSRALANRAVALHAAAEAAFVDALQRGLDQAERVFFRFHQAERELLLEIVAAELGHVDRHAGASLPSMPDFRSATSAIAVTSPRSRARIDVEFFLECQHFRLLHRWSPGCLTPPSVRSAVHGEDPLF